MANIEDFDQSSRRRRLDRVFAGRKGPKEVCERIKMINLDDLDDDVILCNICNNEYDEQQRSPKLLPCLHTLCKDCTLNGIRGSVLTCSICNEEHQLPNDLELLKDSTMSNMMDMIKIQRKSTSIKCSDCPDNDRGEFFCKDCYVFLCKECTSAHRRTQVTRRHVVLTIEEFKTSGIENFSRKEMCSTLGHEDQPYSFYCENEECQKPVCTQCVVGDHSQANGHAIRNLTEIYEENKHAFERQIGELLNKLSDVSSNAKGLESETKNIENKQTDMVNEIDKVFDALEILLKDRRDKLKQRVDVICQQRIADIKGQLGLLQKSKSEMENSCNYSSRMLVFTNKSEFLQLKPTVITKLDRLVDSDLVSKSLEPVQLSFNAGIDQARLEDIVNNIGEITTNVYGDMADGNKANGRRDDDLELKLPYRGPPINPPGTYTTNKFPSNRPNKLYKPPNARVEPLKLDSITNEGSHSPVRGVKTSPSEENTLGRPLSLKSPVINTNKQATSLGDFLNNLELQTREIIREKRYTWMKGELQTKSHLFLKNRAETQDASDGDDSQRQLPKTPTSVPSSVVLTKRSVVSPSMAAPAFGQPKTPTTKSSPTTPKFPATSPLFNGGVSPTTPTYMNNYKKMLSPSKSPDVEKSFSNSSSIMKTPGSNLEQTNKAVTWGSRTANGVPKSVPTKPDTLVLTESSYPEVKQSTPSPRKTTPDKPVTFGDIVCPDFQMDVDTAHHEREVTADGRTLRNKKTEVISSRQYDIENSLVQYKGAIGTQAFQEAGRFYYEVDIVYNIQQPLEETWLVFEIGICRLDDVDMHHTVERHEFARSFYVARYPEDGHLTQEFWHNRDLLHFQSLSDNTAGLEVRVTYGFLVDTKRKKWTVVDCNNNKVLHNFDQLDFTDALHPVFGCYNPDLITVEMTLKTGTDITIVPQCLKTGYIKS